MNYIIILPGTKLTKMAKNQPTTRRTMADRWSSIREYHFLGKLYNKLLGRLNYDDVDFRGRGWVECACMRWERSRKREHTNRVFPELFQLEQKSPLTKLSFEYLLKTTGSGYSTQVHVRSSSYNRNHTRYLLFTKLYQVC